MQEQLFDVPDILFSCRNGGQTIDFLLAGEKIGGCDVNTGFHANISFLKYIYIAPRYAHQGLGTKCMNKLCWHLRQKGFIRLDTDTADNNLNAQGYYIKTGFTDQGRMRSYCTR